VPGIPGGPSGTRTLDPRVKSLLRNGSSAGNGPGADPAHDRQHEGNGEGASGVAPPALNPQATRSALVRLTSLRSGSIHTPVPST